MGFNHLLCVAPMMDWTDRHCRYFHRLLAPSALLYTEMLTTGAVIHGDRERLLGFDPAEHPVALQLGGSEPEALARAAAIGAEFGYDEINLNVGCPSDRVQRGRFGACLMKEPDLVAECIRAMRAAVACPVTVKTRIGVDDLDDEADLHRFAGILVEAGLETLIVHARKAWLSGLSPKENREVPALDYPRVYRLASAFPDLEVVINGGITALADVREHLRRVDGVMLGRAAYQNPWILAELETEFGAADPPSDRASAVHAMAGYAANHLASGGRLHQAARHMLGLFHGRPGARQWRRTLSQSMHRDDAGPELLVQASPEPADGQPAAAPDRALRSGAGAG